MTQKDLNRASHELRAHPIAINANASISGANDMLGTTF